MIVHVKKMPPIVGQLGCMTIKKGRRRWMDQMQSMVENITLVREFKSRFIMLMAIDVQIVS